MLEICLEPHFLLPEFAHASPVLPDRAVLVASPPFASWSWLMSPPSAELLLFDSDVDVAFEFPDVALPDVSLSSSPPELLLAALLAASALPEEAFELLLFEALPLLDTLALLCPPLPPHADAEASPEFPDLAVVSPSLLPLPLELAVALPVGPEVAELVASPPLASWF